jgi:proteasome lid subunit RPN8/RPN11
MLGRYGDERYITEIVPMANSYQGDRRVRYSIDPMEYYRAEMRAAEMKMRIFGVYHSHPDVLARPSAFDLEHFFPWYSYLIVSVVGGSVAEYRAWKLDESGGAPKASEESLEIV